MFVSGRVQGVGYRQFVHGAAERIGVGGYVRNLADGRVEVYAIGKDAQLRTLLEELRRGPRHAIVEEVGETDAEVVPEFAVHFSVKYDGQV
jgi:acylphosphatase